MDSFGISNIKIEKANALLRYRRLQKITTLLRFIEICFLLIMLARFSTQFPVAFKLSGAYFRGLSVSLISPRFVFVVGNVIVFILFVKSGKFSTEDSTGNNICIDFYDEYVLNSEKNRKIHQEQSEHQRKDDDDTFMANMYSSREKKIYRSQSEKLKNMHHEKAHPELRRWATERCPKSMNHSEKLVVRSYSEDEMSNEEFRRTVEAFIARQQRFLREEEFSPIVSLDA